MSITEFKCKKCNSVMEWEDADIKNIDYKICTEETIEEIECDECGEKYNIQARIDIDIFETDI